MSPDGRSSVLYLDVEGGWGGSSRSLGLLVTHLDRARIDPYVVLRKKGPSHDLYAAQGIGHELQGGMPAFQPGLRKNALTFALFARAWLRAKRLRRHLLDIIDARNVDLIHVNHEGLAPLGRWLAHHSGRRWLCHLRNTYPDNAWSRWLYRLMAQADGFIYISENEREHLVRLAGLKAPPPQGEVIHNSAPALAADPQPDPVFPAAADGLRVLVLANLDAARGIDRVADVAFEIRRRGRDDIIFLVFGGESQSSRPWRKDFGVALAERIRAQGLQHCVRLMGHTDRPERALVSSDVLFRPRRQNNPWGRDVIEGMAAGLPIIAMGEYEGFVESGRGGFIEREFTPQTIADRLLFLRDNAQERLQMGTFNRAKAARLFDARRNAAAVEQLYARILGGSGTRM